MTDTALVDYGEVRRLADVVNQRIEQETLASGVLDGAAQRQLAMSLLNAELTARRRARLDAGQGTVPPAAEAALRDAVVQTMFGMGRLAAVLAMPEVEDIYISGASELVLRYAGGRLERHPPVAESDEDLLAQVSAIAQYQGMNERGLTRARPYLDMNLYGHRARMAVMFDITPHPQVTIRKHRFVDIGLEQLVSMGTISRAMMAYLQACVVARRSMLVVGDQAVGKTTMLRALALCLPSDERFATMETEFELLLHDVPGRFPLLIPMEERLGSGERDSAGKVAGEITLEDMFPRSLRHSLQRIIFGEVRAAEVLSMISAMSRGYRGSMSTFHANSALGVFESMASLILRHAPTLTHEAALRQIATAVDVIVYVDREATVDGDIRYVSHILDVPGAVTDSNVVVTSPVFTPREDSSDPRGYPAGVGEDTAWMVRAGLDPAWLTRPDLADWAQPVFPARAR